MKKIKLILALALMSISTQFSYAQVSFSHSLGGAIYSTSNALVPALVYSPRVNFLQLASEATVSAGTHLGLGFNYSSDGGSNYFAYEVPLVAELNIGSGSSPDSDVGFGGFLGLGYGINKIGSADIGSAYNDASGIYVNAGLRAIINDQPMGVRVSYLMNNKVGYTDVVGFTFFYMLGE